MKIIGYKSRCFLCLFLSGSINNVVNLDELLVGTFEFEVDVVLADDILVSPNHTLNRVLLADVLPQHILHGSVVGIQIFMKFLMRKILGHSECL